MKRVNRIFGLVFCGLLVGCSTDNLPSSFQVTSSTFTSSSVNTGDMINSDINSSFSDSLSTIDTSSINPNDNYILLADSNSTTNANGVIINNNIITINKKGDYTISGLLSNGQIIVNVDEQVNLTLSNATINCDYSAPLAMYGKKKKTITLAKNTVNNLSDGASYSSFFQNDEPNAALFAKNDLLIAGEGILNIQANYNNGIGTKDNLIIDGGKINIIAHNNGIKGNDSITIDNSDINIESIGDGMKSDDTAGGIITLSNNNITIKSDEDGISAYRNLIINGGNYNIMAGNSGSLSIYSPSDSTSRKGIKSDLAINIMDGNIEIDSFDDAIHCGGTIDIYAGDIVIMTKDDGIHADKMLTINNGNIDIKKTYEGIESPKVYINGGTIKILSSDDGINAADGTYNPPGQPNNNCILQINGGNITINTIGDGLDSNGILIINGGTILVHGPSSNNNSSLDADGGVFINGGTVIASGSNGMIEVPQSTSTQASIVAGFASPIPSGNTIYLKDSDQDVIMTYQSIKNFQAITLSSSVIEIGKEYYLYNDNTLLFTINITTLVTKVGNINGPR